MSCAKILSLSGDVRFYGLLDSARRFWNFDLMDFLEITEWDIFLWHIHNFLNELRSNVICSNSSKNINIFWSVEILTTVLTTSYFIGLFPPEKYDFVKCTYVNTLWNRFLVEVIYAQLLLKINSNFYHWYHCILVQTDSFRNWSQYIWMYVRIVVAIICLRQK